MLEILCYIISALSISLITMYIFNNISNNHNFGVRKVLIFIFAIFVFITNYAFSPPFFRQIVITLLLMLISLYGYDTDIKDSIINMIYLQIMVIFAELIYTIIYFILSSGINLMVWNHSVIGVVVTNIFVPLIVYLLYKIKVIKGFYFMLKSFTCYLSENKVLLFVIFYSVMANVMFYAIYYMYYEYKAILFITFAAIFTIYTVILFIILRVENNYDKLNDKYSLTLENLKTYEQLLDQYRVANHENKNQLLMIRGMTKNKSIISYIDKIIDYKEQNNKDIYNLVKRIPLSSIHAVLYNKILLMANKKIQYSLAVDRNLVSKDFAHLTPENILDICSIVNILIDNAIDETSNQTNGQILIEFNKLDDRIEIAVSNTCREHVNVNEIFNMGYSTKGENHGYGLTIVKEIIKNNYSLFKDDVEMLNNIFTYHLYIKIKM